MYLEQFHSFCAVVDYGSYTRAAHHLDLTQPAVSHHIRNLERAFGVSLFERVGGRIQPTQAGEVVYRHSVEILAQVDAMRDTIETAKGLHGGRVVVGAGTGVANHVLPPVVARFRHSYPEVRVDMRADQAPRIFEQVLHGLVDFGIAIGYRVPRGLVTEPLYQDPIVLVAAPEHPVMRRWPEGVPVAALASLPLIALSQRVSITRQLCDQWFGQIGIEPAIEMEFDSADAIMRVVSRGIGAAFLYLSMVAAEVEVGRLRIAGVAGPPLFGQFVLARRPRQHVSVAAQQFVRTLVADLHESLILREVNVHAADRFAADRRSSTRSV